MVQNLSWRKSNCTKKGYANKGTEHCVSLPLDTSATKERRPPEVHNFTRKEI